MNRNTQRVDDLLRTTEAPSFGNPEHQARLLVALLERHAEAVEAPSERRPWATRRTVWAAAAVVLACLAIALPMQSLFAPGSVRAEVLTALEQVNSFVMISSLFREGGETGASVELGTFYFREGVGTALHAPREKVWNVGNDFYRYRMESDEVTIIRGMGMLPVKACFRDNRMLTGWGQERDHGKVVRDGQAYRMLEVLDDSDPTQRAEVYYDPETMLPVTVATYARNTADEPWRLAREDTFAYNALIDDGVFVPDYPGTAKVTERAPQPHEIAAMAGHAAEQDTAWMQDAAAIVFHGDKFLAVEDVWLSPSGWIGLKFRTNLESAFTIPVGFSEDPANQRRWNADKFTLHNLAGGTMLEAAAGVTYLSFNGSSSTRNDDGTQGDAYFYHPIGLEELPSDDLQPTHVCFRTIAIIRDRGRGETLKHYFDWKDEPEKWQMLELTIPVPEPSLTPPPSFNEKDLAWMQHTGVEARALADHLVAMRNTGRNEEAYLKIKDEPASVQRLYGGAWVHCLLDAGRAEAAYALYTDRPMDERLQLGPVWIGVLRELGKEDEARKFFQSYKGYCTERLSEPETRDYLIRDAESFMKEPAEKP